MQIILRNLRATVEVFKKYGIETFLSFLFTIFSVFLSTIISVFLARTLVFSDFALYNSIVSHILIFSLIVSSGWQLIMLRFVTDYRIGKSKSELTSLVLFASCFTGLMYLLLMFSIHSSNMMIVLGVEDFALTLDQVPFLILYFGLLGTFSCVLKGLDKAVLGQFCLLLARPITYLLFLLAAYFSSRKFNLDTAINVLNLALLSSVLTCLLFVYIYGKEYWTRKITFKAMPMWLRMLSSTYFIGVIVVLNQQISVLVLEHTNNRAEIGLYVPAMQFALLAAIGVNAVEGVQANRIRKLWSSNDIARLNTLIRYMTIFSSIFSFSIMLLALLWGDKIIVVLFGAEFANAYSILLLLCFALFIKTIFGSALLLLSVSGHESVAFVFHLIQLVATLAIGMVVVDEHGALGAAFAFALGTCFSSLSASIYCLKNLKINPFLFGINSKRFI